ncbi:MAG TPA: serine/threonine-protein kinase [Gemmata sp.]|jgi:serine/threonine protein kinase/Tol biopolymer transport system component|nr:serine/threonine-protein kinase [Gemmata sp.]
MSAPATVSDFLSLVKKSGVLDEKRFAEQFPDQDELPNHPTECANALIKSGLLTAFQARQILAGKFRGLVLGMYKVLRPIGQGGMGVVCLGEHRSLHRRVALKILPAKQAGNQLALERFMREARATAALDHPNIVRLHDVCQEAGTHFLVMELVEGKNLHTLLSETGPLHFATAVSHAAQAAEGLQHAHAKGFVHRDIKPANLMINKDGVIKILDMGLARSFQNEQDNLTGTIGEEDGVYGTLDYVSPEQAIGQPVDERADLYSLGATLFYLIAGHSPYKGSRAQILLQHQMTAPPRLSKTLKVPVPDALNDVIAKMMAKKKSDRYQSAEEVIDALSPWLPASPSTGNIQASIGTQDLRGSGEPTVRERPRSRKGRNRKGRKAEAPNLKKWYAIGGAAVVAVLLIGILIAVFGSGSKKPTIADSSPPPPAINGSNRAAGQAEESQLLLTTTAQVNDLTISRDGTRFAAVDWSGNLIYGNTSNWQKLNSVVVQGGTSLNCCTATPDGKFVVVAGRQTLVMVYDWGTGERLRTFPGHSDTTWGVAVSPSGKMLLTCGNDGEVILRDFASGEQIHKFEFEAKQVWSVAFSPDGTKIAASCAAGPNEAESHQIRVWDTATGKELQRFTGHTRDVRWVTFSPDGRTIASAGFDGTIRQWDVADGKQVNSINAHGNNYAERVSYLKGGKRLASCGAFFPSTSDGGGALRVWDAGTGQEVHSWRGYEAKGVISLAISPDGTYALTGSREKTVRLWKLKF